MKQESIVRYLKKYQWGNYAAVYNPIKELDSIVVIPAIQEYKNVQRLLASLAKNNPVDLSHSLFLFSVNNSFTAKEEVRKDNELLLELLKKCLDTEEQHKLIGGETTVPLGYVDAASPGKELPDETAGVGLARKIGMDLALTLFTSPEKRNILVCLDADCTVPPNYLSVIRQTMLQHPEIHAAAVQYEHPLDGNDLEKVKAIICYELFLRYYSVGLTWADSPYAFHSIGSAMLCDPETYIKCEGMNKKKAGEDFYFLEKIAKTETVYTINSTRVYPSARGSWRVPFGTGQRVNRFLSGKEPEYFLYDPETFSILRSLLRLLSDKELTTDFVMEEVKRLSQPLSRFLEAQKFREFREKIIGLPERQFLAQGKFWFDGFKTMKCLHYLRDNGYALQPMFTALPRLLKLIDAEFEWPETEIIPDVAEQIRILQKVRDISCRYAPARVD